jgi:hypothetical protein
MHERYRHLLEEMYDGREERLLAESAGKVLA